MKETDLKYIEDLLLNLKYKEALTKVEYLLEEDSNNIILLDKCGDAYKGLGDYEQAMKYHSQAYKLDKSNQSIKTKLLNDIHLKDQKDYEIKNRKIKEKKSISDYFPFLEDFFNKKIL